MPANSSALDKILIRNYTFKRWQFFWYSVHYSSGIIAVISGVLVTASGTQSGPDFIQSYTWLWGLLAALLSGVVTFLGPLQKAERYKHAYYSLDTALVNYEIGLLKSDKLMEEYVKANNMVLFGNSKPSK